MSDALALVEDALADRLGRPPDRHHPIGSATTYRVGGAAELFVRVEDPEELAAVAAALGVPGGAGVPVLVLGRGSNLLVADRGLSGLAIQLGESFAEVTLPRPPRVIVRAGAAASLPVVARQTAAAGLRGFEWAVGVPGSVGGAVRMNAGGHGSDMAESLTRVRVVDLRSGHDEVVDAARLDLAYRHSSVPSDAVVAWAELRLTRGDAAAALAQVDEIVRWRRANQPGGPNAGSVFTNPPGDSAGRLADTAGCRGLRVGTAQVSTKHANFIQADPGGRADDIVALMKEVQRRVLERHGIRLVAETRLVGFDPESVATLVGAS